MQWEVFHLTAEFTQTGDSFYISYKGSAATTWMAHWRHRQRRTFHARRTMPVVVRCTMFYSCQKLQRGYSQSLWLPPCTFSVELRVCKSHFAIFFICTYFDGVWNLGRWDRQMACRADGTGIMLPNCGKLDSSVVEKETITGRESENKVYF